MGLANRYDFVLLFDVQDGNPNGDPDAGNMPRVDAETGKGLVTDVSLKRKVRNYVGLTKGEQPPHDIYIKEKSVLNQTHEKAYVAIGKEDELKSDKKRKGSADTVEKARQLDVRKLLRCPHLRRRNVHGCELRPGARPVQLTFGRSTDPIFSHEHSDHPHGCGDRGRGREAAGRQSHHGAEVHRSLRSLSRPRFHLRPSGRPDRVFRG